MRIVTGRLRGRNIITPDGLSTRPTSDQARESLFNILIHADWAPPLEGASVADIFAGSGALGFEAISRGAEFCLFVENNPKAIAALRANQSQMGLEENTRIVRQNAARLRIAPANMRGQFSYIFMDPPYHKALWRPALSQIKAGNYVADEGIIVLEVAADEEVDSGDFTLIDSRVWGAAKMLFLS